MRPSTSASPSCASRASGPRCPNPRSKPSRPRCSPPPTAAGEFIIRQGEPGRHLHVLTSGETDVRMHAPGGVVITVAELSAGACFGEMSLLSGDLTSADVIARTDCQTLTLDRRTFEALVAGEPQLLREFVRMVSKRLRESNVAMGAAREKEKGLTRFLQDARTELYGEIVGASPAIRTLQTQIDAQAKLDGPVLIEGERGTGKELIARLIHFRSARKDAPLLSTDCAQIAETPWGDKLFGDYRPRAGGHGTAAARQLPGSRRRRARSCSRTSPRCRAPSRTGWRRTSRSRRAAPGGDRRRVRIIATCREGLDDPANARNVSPALARHPRGADARRPAASAAQAGHRRAGGALRGQARAAARQAGARAGRRGAGQARHARVPGRQRPRAGGGDPARGDPHRRPADRVRGDLPRRARAGVALGVQPALASRAAGAARAAPLPARGRRRWPRWCSRSSSTSAGSCRRGLAGTSGRCSCGRSGGRCWSCRSSSPAAPGAPSAR